MSMYVKRKLYERIVILIVMYMSESWSKKLGDRKNLNVAEMKCQRVIYGVKRMDRFTGESVKGRVGVPEESSGRVDRMVMNWFGHIERMDS